MDTCLELSGSDEVTQETQAYLHDSKSMYLGEQEILTFLNLGLGVGFIYKIFVLLVQ